MLKKIFIKPNFFYLKNKLTTKYFSIYNSDKDKKLSQFFKLPSINNLKDDQIFDKSETDNISVLNTYDDEIDKIDLMNKILKKKIFDQERKIKQFFKGNSDRESIKITQNLIERMRLNKEFRFSEDFKKNEILNEYGNYDKYFENYKVIKEKSVDLEDDGENKWEMKYRELQTKYNNPNNRYQNEKMKKKQLNKMIEDLNNYGYEFTFQDYLNFKDSFEEPDYQSTNPRDPDGEPIQDVDDKLFPIINNKKINYSEQKEQIFGIPEKDDGLKEEFRFKEGMQDFTDVKPTFIKPEDNPLRDRHGEAFHTVNLLTGEGDTPLEYNIRETVKTARNLKNKINEIKKRTMDDAERFDDDLDEEGQKENKRNMARSYLEGWTVKDLSYKYGLMPERINCIVFDRDYFWKHIYPIIGESGLNNRLKDEFEHAKKYGMWDYGKDLELMAQREQGILLKQLTRGEMDAKPTKEHEEKMSRALKNVTPRSHDHVTIGFWGKGGKGYTIKEMIMRRGQGRKRVSKMFDNYLHLKDSHPNCLPGKVIKLKGYGPRIATLGYRF